jgi:hypothetical protein
MRVVISASFGPGPFGPASTADAAFFIPVPIFQLALQQDGRFAPGLRLRPPREHCPTPLEPPHRLPHQGDPKTRRCAAREFFLQVLQALARRGSRSCFQIATPNVLELPLLLTNSLIVRPFLKLSISQDSPKDLLIEILVILR